MLAEKWHPMPAPTRDRMCWRLGHLDPLLPPLPSARRSRLHTGQRVLSQVYPVASQDLAPNPRRPLRPLLASQVP